MNLPKSLALLKRMRGTRLRALRGSGFVIAGSLVSFPAHRSMYLTDKVKGKTRTLYIPLDRLEEVRQWNENHKRARRLISELSKIQRAILVLEIRSAR